MVDHPTVLLGKSAPEPTIPDSAALRAGGAAAVALTVANLLAVVASVALVYVSGMGSSDSERIVIGIALAAGHLGLLFLAFGLSRGRLWARRAGITVALLSLIGFPIGTALGGYVLFQLVFRWRDTE